MYPKYPVVTYAAVTIASIQLHQRTYMYLLGWYLLRPRWVPCWSALAALVAGGVV